MPNAPTHIILTIVLAGLIRDFIVKKRFSSFYILVAGIAGAAPDVDVVLYWFMNIFVKVPLELVHRWFLHSLFIPLIFLVTAFIFYKKKKAFLFFLMISFGIFVHIVLDLLFSGYVRPFYPFSSLQVGLNLIPNSEFGRTIVLGLDAILLTFWMMWEYWQRNIKEWI